MSKDMAQKKQTLWSNITEFFFLLLVVFLIRTCVFGLYQVPTGSMETTMLVGERFFADKFTYLFKNPVRGDIIAFNDPLFTFSKNKVISLFQQYVWGPSNWTKRVIGIPGDHVRGAVEDEKTVIYLNGKKLDEQYLNQYPLLHVWKQDPQELHKQIESELAGMFHSQKIDNSIIEKVVMKKLSGQTTFRSYDPNSSFEKQPFYKITSDRIVRDQQGELELLWPTVGTKSSIVSLSKEKNKNYWDGSDEFSVQLAEDQYWVMGDNRKGSKDCRVFGPIQGKQIHGRIVFRIWSIDSEEAWWIVDLIKHPIAFYESIRWNRFFELVK